MRVASAPPAHDPFDSDPFGPNAFGGDTVPAPPPDVSPGSAPGATLHFDPARATLPLLMGIEPSDRPFEMPSMRATLPMPLELPKDLEAMFAETGDVPVRIEGVRLDTVDVLEGTPRAVQEMLAERAEIVELGPDEEVSGFGGAMLVSGMAILCATIVDAAAHWARPGELLVAKGSLAEGIAVRVVGAGDGARIAVWPRASIEEAIGASEAAIARARALGDRLQALAGATMGPFGEIDDDARRALAMELTVRCLRPGEIWLEDGAPAPGVALVGAGEVELYGPISEDTSETVEPGALVFPDLAVLGGEAPSSARAGAHGALLLIAERDVAKRLSSRIPDLADRLRGA